MAEYIVIDGVCTDGMSFDLCSKTLTLEKAPQSVHDLPVWSISWEDEKGCATEVHMVPRRIYRDPFRPGDNVLVLCDCYDEPDLGSGENHGGPAFFNTRAGCDAVMSRAMGLGDDPWFGMEQEYYLLDVRTRQPLGWPQDGLLGKHDDAYFCSVGAQKSIAREVVEAHARGCMYAGIKFGGINSEVAPSQWEFQIGPCSGIQAGDDLWAARYILQRVCEMYKICVTFDPKPVPGWAGIGCHTNYSTVATRTKPGGYDAMLKQIAKLRARHHEHMLSYGHGNERRLTGVEHTAGINDFSYGVADRSASIRIGNKIVEQDCGYYEDRRPAANMDPYLVTKLLVETTLLGFAPQINLNGQARHKEQLLPGMVP